MADKEKLFDEFPLVTTEEWMEKVRSDLKGADFDKKLVWSSREGLRVKPFYRSEDIEDLLYDDYLPGHFPYTRGTNKDSNSWLVRQNIEVVDFRKANVKALNILGRGVDSLGFIITDPESVNENNIRVLLQDIKIENVEINILSKGKAKEILDCIVTITRERGIDSGKIFGAIEADPFGRLLLKGKLCVSVEEGLDYLADITSASQDFSNMRTLQINASNFHNAGSDIVKELAFAISMGNEYMSQFTERGMKAEFAASKIRFSFGISANYFVEIAKLRAARLLWSTVLNVFAPDKAEAIKMNIHCVTGRWNKTVYDPYVNMLRTQTEAMSAVLGGTDSLTVEPFDTVFRSPGDFSERIARNQQLILREEAYFDKVADPAAGSYYIEMLTNQIADNAWKLFLEIEEKGGFLAAVKSGSIQKLLRESAEELRKDTANRKITLLGTNKFPDNNEVMPSIDSDVVFSETSDETDLIVDKLSFVRGGEEYEKLRMNVDKCEKRPSVFLLPIGSPVMGKARAQFSAGFFGCTGYKIIDNNIFDNADDGIKEAVDSKADIVVICSSDEEYMLFTPEIHKRLKDKAIIVIAGNPESSGELKAIGIEHFIHLRSNTIETLKNFNTLLGLSS